MRSGQENYAHLETDQYCAACRQKSPRLSGHRVPIFVVKPPLPDHVVAIHYKRIGLVGKGGLYKDEAEKPLAPKRFVLISNSHRLGRNPSANCSLTIAWGGLRFPTPTHDRVSQGGP
jgi:hypothetical protein